MRREERAGGPVPKRSRMLREVLESDIHNVCVFCTWFNKNAYILTKRAPSFSLSQCDAVHPPSEQCRATAHSKDSRASLATKAAISVSESVGSYSGNLALATRCDKAWIYPSIQMQTTPFQWRGAVSNIASKRAGSETRGIQSARKRSYRKSPSERAGEQVLQPLFHDIQKNGGLRPILDLRPINRALGKHPFRMLTLKHGLRGLVCICGFKRRVLSHSDSTVSQMVSKV